MKENVIGYWSVLGGIEVHDILYGIEDKIVCTTGAWLGSDKRKKHTVKIHYENRPYIKLYGSRYYLDECIRN